ncbi:MAG TPA: hypothetical protein VN624_00230 [Rhodanobacter sp.]|nr:hypothetical protein [Rhodanobacter sp.]
MKTLFAATALLLLPMGAHAGCVIKDFAIANFTPAMTSVGSSTRITLRGELVNHCAEAAAGQIRIDIKDDKGNVVQSKDVWPAGTGNISPGDKVSFDVGRMFRYKDGMSAFTATITDVRTW